MHYKTIVLEMLQDRPALYESLRGSKRLLPAMEAYATDLRDRHLTWEASLRRLRPGSERATIASEALELAIEETLNRLPCGSNPAEGPAGDPLASSLADSLPA